MALKLRRLAKHSGEDKLVRTAAFVGLIGSTGDPKATEVYQALVALFFTDARILTWDAGLDCIPGDVQSVLKLQLAIQAAALLEPVEKAKFGVVHFVKVALLLPDPKGYVEVCKREQHKLIRSVFHPNTLQYIAGRYRGVVGDLADTEYLKQINEAVQTIS